MSQIEITSPSLPISPPPVPPTEIAATPPKPKSKLPLLVVVLLITVLGLSSYIAYDKFLATKTITPLTPSPSPTETSAKENDPTSTWQTYTDDKYHFSFKYPPRFNIAKDQFSTTPEGHLQFATNEKADMFTIDVVSFSGTRNEFIERYTTNDPTTNIIMTTISAQTPLGEIVKTGNENYTLYKYVNHYDQTINPGAIDITTYTAFLVPDNTGVIFRLNNTSDNAGETTQILQTFKFTEKSATYPILNLHGTLQDFLVKNCNPGNPQSISLDVLPFTLNQSTLKTTPQPNGITAYCNSTEPEKISHAILNISLSNNQWLLIHDNGSQELGHGGPPFIGLIGKTILDEDSTKIGAYATGGEGPTLLGEIGIGLRGIKEFRTLDNNPVYISLSQTGVESTDPRLLDYLRPFTKESGFDKPEVIWDSDLENNLINFFFANPQTTEITAINNLKQKLNSINPK